MTVHTNASFWDALRAIVPNLPAEDVTRCVITLDHSRSPEPLVEMTILARDEAGRLRPDTESLVPRIAAAFKLFKIVPVEEGQA